MMCNVQCGKPNNVFVLNEISISLFTHVIILEPM